MRALQHDRAFLQKHNLIHSGRCSQVMSNPDDCTSLQRIEQRLGQSAFRSGIQPRRRLIQ
ncbi:hypothetical protein D1872_284740 [compost metagenome]